MLVIPENKLVLNMLVHVEGFVAGAVYRYRGKQGDKHILFTPKTRRMIATSRRLMYTRKQQERIENEQRPT